MSFPQPGSPPPPGWYPVKSDTLRWWDGKHWSNHRFVNGKHRMDWANTSQPLGLTWTFAGLFLLLGLMQLLLSPVSGILLSFAGVIWLGLAIGTTMVLRNPTPTTDPVILDELRPLPGDAEGPNAGWAPVSPSKPLTASWRRWWTGRRWSHYLVIRDRVLPTFHAADQRARIVILSWLLLAGGVIGTGAAILLIATESGGISDVGLGFLIIGPGLLLAGILIVTLVRSQLRAQELPTEPPQLPPQHSIGATWR